MIIYDTNYDYAKRFLNFIIPACPESSCRYRCNKIENSHYWIRHWKRKGNLKDKALEEKKVTF